MAQTRPLLSMLLGVVLYSAYPLVGFLSKDLINPSLLITIAHFGSLTIFVLIIATYKSLSQTNTFIALRSLLHDPKTLAYGLFDGLLNATSHILLLLSFVFVDKYTASLIYDVWPVLTMFLLARLIPEKEALSKSDWIFTAVSAVGMALVIFAQAEGPAESNLFSFTANAPSTTGLILAVISMAAMAISSSIIVVLERRISDNLRVATPAKVAAVRRPIGPDDSGPLPASETFTGETTTTPDRSPASPLSSILASAVSRFFSVIFAGISLLLFYPDNVQLVVADTPLPVGIIAAATVIVTFGSLLFIYANSISTFPGINILWNLTPLLAVVFLYFGGGRDPIASQLLLGAMLIMSANLAVSIRIDFRLSYLGSLLFLCAAAVYCFFVPGAPIGSYYEAIGVPAGIFAILVAFMTQRLADRQARLEELAITLHEVVSTPDHSNVRKKVNHFLSKLFSPVSAAELERDTVRLLEAVGPRNPTLSDVIMQLAANRLRVISFGEVFVLWLIGGATVLIAVLGRPATIQANLLAVVLAGAIAYLALLVLDTTPHERGQFLTRLFVRDRLQDPQTENRRAIFVSCIAAAFSVVIFLLYSLAMYMKLSGPGPAGVGGVY